MSKEKKKHSINFLAGKYITRLFANKLSSDLLFHNFYHTSNVVRGVKEISKNLQLDKNQREILLVAAWFHDSGHIVKYIGHEAESQKLAKDWLLKNDYPEEKIKQVCACIAATDLTKEPTTLLQKVICDADLYHLSLGAYCHIQFQLREEFKRVFQKEYTDLEWMMDNVKFIQNHRYFTTYGQTVLEERKQKNIELCLQLQEEYREVMEK